MNQQGRTAVRPYGWVGEAAKPDQGGFYPAIFPKNRIKASIPLK